MTGLSHKVGPEDHVQGSRSAAIVLVEYGDFECPYCGAAYGELKLVQKAMGDSLCFVFRNFPLTMSHPNALNAAMFAEAAATVGRFWEMHDILFEHQSALDERSLERYGRKLGMTDGIIASALHGDFEQKVRRDFSSGVRSGVNGTPCLFVNGVRYNGPAQAAALLALFRQR